MKKQDTQERPDGVLGVWRAEEEGGDRDVWCEDEEGGRQRGTGKTGI